MAEKKKSAKKIKDLDPKAKGAKVKGGGNVLTGEQRKFVRKVVGKATNLTDGTRN